MRRYWAWGRPDDLQAALDCWQQAVQRTPPGHPDLPSRLNNLGAGLRARYARTGRLEDLEEALTVYRQAVAATPPGHPDLPMYLNNLGAGLSARYARTGQRADLEQAIGHWETARAHLHAVVRTGLEAAPLAGQAAAITRQLVSAHLTLNDPAAALAAAEAGRGVRLRLELARAGRVPAGLTPAEADKYRRLMKEVRAVASQRRNLDREGLPSAEHAARLAELSQRHAGITRRLEELEARDPDFAGRPPDYIAMAELARAHDLTLVFLVPTDKPDLGTVAFLVAPKGGGREGERGRGKEPEVLYLRELTRRDLRRLLFALPEGAEWGPALLDCHLSPDDVGWLSAYWLTHLARQKDLRTQSNRYSLPARRLWHATMLRVLAELGGKLMAPLAERLAALGARRVVIVPGDNLGLLPLHAVPSPLPNPPPPFPKREGGDPSAVTPPSPRRGRAGGEVGAGGQEAGEDLPSPRRGRAGGEVEAGSQEAGEVLPSPRRGGAGGEVEAGGQEAGEDLPSPRRGGAGGEVEAGAGGEVFGDRFEVSYAPSAAALARAVGQLVGRSLRSPDELPYLVAVANPDGSLAFADDEVAAIAGLFDGRAHVAYGPQARKAWLLAHAGEADYLELSTHGSFAPGAPDKSGLLLAHPEGHTAPLWRADVHTQRQPLALLQAGCEQLTLDDVWAGRLPLQEGCVVTLDACETAQVEPGEEADESLGFPAAFLSAGAASVIASLWAVDDFSTSLLMTETYRRMLAGERPSRALQAAGQWLRSLPKAEVLRRLDAAIAPLLAEKRAGVWDRLSRVERAQRFYRLAGLENRRDSLRDEPDDPPFAHPVWWAAFAAYGA